MVCSTILEMVSPLSKSLLIKPVIISEFVSSLKEGFDRDKNMSQAMIKPGDYRNRCMLKFDGNTYGVRGTGEDNEVGGSVRLGFALALLVW